MKKNRKGLKIIGSIAFGLVLMPGFISNLFNKIMTKCVGYDLASKSFLSSVSKITVPTMMIQKDNDPWTEIDHAKDI